MSVEHARGRPHEEIGLMIKNGQNWQFDDSSQYCIKYTVRNENKTVKISFCW